MPQEELTLLLKEVPKLQKTGGKRKGQQGQIKLVGGLGRRSLDLLQAALWDRIRDREKIEIGWEGQRSPSPTAMATSLLFFLLPPSPLCPFPF